MFLRKELLIVIFLTILAAGSSWFWVSAPGSCVPIDEGITCYDGFARRGFPRPYWQQFEGFYFANLLLDFIFYFVLFRLIWTISKRITKK